MDNLVDAVEAFKNCVRPIKGVALSEHEEGLSGVRGSRPRMGGLGGEPSLGHGHDLSVTQMSRTGCDDSGAEAKASSNVTETKVGGHDGEHKENHG